MTTKYAKGFFGNRLLAWLACLAVNDPQSDRTTIQREVDREILETCERIFRESALAYLACLAVNNPQSDRTTIQRDVDREILETCERIFRESTFSVFGVFSG